MIDRRIHTLLRNDTPPTPTLQSHCRQQPIPPIAPLRSMSHFEPCDPERPYCSCSSYCLDNVRPVQTVTNSPPSGCLIILLTLVSGHLIGMTPTTCVPHITRILGVVDGIARIVMNNLEILRLLNLRARTRALSLHSNGHVPCVSCTSTAKP